MILLCMKLRVATGTIIYTKRVEELFLDMQFYAISLYFQCVRDIFLAIINEIERLQNGTGIKDKESCVLL